MSKTIISFQEIYKKSIGLFDDPKITEAYEDNEISFAKNMYVYLQNAIGGFDSPLSIAEQLGNYAMPTGIGENFASAIDTPPIVFSLDPDFTLIETNFANGFYVDGNYVSGGVLDTLARTVSFSQVGTEYLFEQYGFGQFELDLSLIVNSKTQQIVLTCIKDILARLLVISWAEESRNFLLDIQNILTDTDFKLHPASNALRSKNEWVRQLHEELGESSNKLSWNVRFAKQRG